MSIQSEARDLPRLQLRILTLGGFHLLHQADGIWVEVQDKELSARGPALTLLKFLLCGRSSTPPHYHASRDRLIDALWPDEERMPAEPERALAVAKSVLNKALKPFTREEVILLTDGSDKIGYRLNMDCLSLDADDVETLVARASEAEGRGETECALQFWEAAHELMRGEFLPQDQYNDWSTQRRQRLQSKERLMLHRLAHLYSINGRSVEAIALVHPYVLAHPTDVDALYILTQLLTQQGRYEETLQLLQECQRLLQEEGMTLPPQIYELKQRIRQAQTTMLTQMSFTISTPATLMVPRITSFDGESLSPSPFSLTLAPSFEKEDTWFNLKQKLITILATQWAGRAQHCISLQGIINQEIAMFDLVKAFYPSETYILSRRRVLHALVTLPATLLGTLQHDSLSPARIEEVLPACAGGITACWHLLNDGEFDVVQRLFVQSFSALEQIVQQSNRYRKPAAALSSQAYLLAGLVALHHGNLLEREQYCRRAVTHAEASGDHNLLIASQIHLANACLDLKRLPEAVHIFREASEKIQILPLLRSKVLAEFAAVYGQMNQSEEALRCIGNAFEVFPDAILAETPSYLSTDFGAFSLILWEGMTRRELGQHHPSETHYQKAEEIFAGVEKLAATTSSVPIRFRLEILNHRADVALRMQHLDAFCDYLEQGIRGAQALGSQKRRQEVVALYKEVRRPDHAWRNEPRLREVGDLFIQ